jgi:hypothetical protein
MSTVTRILSSEGIAIPFLSVPARNLSNPWGTAIQSKTKAGPIAYTFDVTGLISFLFAQLGAE